MQFDRVKKPSEALALLGLEYEIDSVDGNSYVLKLKTPGGEVIRIEAADYGGLRFSVPTKPKLVKRWRVSGEINGLRVDQLFETEYEAIRASGGSDMLTVEAVEIPEP